MTTVYYASPSNVIADPSAGLNSRLPEGLNQNIIRTKNAQKAATEDYIGNSTLLGIGKGAAYGIGLGLLNGIRSATHLGPNPKDGHAEIHPFKHADLKNIYYRPHDFAKTILPTIGLAALGGILGGMHGAIQANQKAAACQMTRPERFA